ncbi:MAG TPA: hypothetical protein VG055_08760 [Planctomycetaceae bacterium]|jgi:hypothetical protein|nr:hypothetical protein [Planctomycetaceae bacterium]
MKRPRIAALAILAAIVAATTHVLAADAPTPQPANDSAAEAILQKARQAVVAVPRIRIECDWSHVFDPLETETRGHQTLYVEKSIGYLAESRFVPLAGQSSRARTRAGRPCRLESKALTNTRQLYRDRSVTFFDKLDKKKYVVVKDATKRWEPAALVGGYIPPGLDYAIAWEDVRSRYRIEKGPSTPTTVGIVLTLRGAKSLPGTRDRQRDASSQQLADFVSKHSSDHRERGPGSDGNELKGRLVVYEDVGGPERHEIVLDRRSLLPVSWRCVRGESDWLNTYTCFDLNPAPEDMTAPSPKTQDPSLAVIMETRTDGQPEPAEPEDYLMAIQATVCALRLVHLF